MATEHAATQAILRRPMPALDGVRGIAIALVVVAHFMGAYEPTGPVGRRVFELVRSGWCGVDLFFVLSGFLITGILADTRLAHGYFRAFYMRRFLRIFPLYYALLFVWFAVLATLAARAGWDAQAIGRDRQLWYWAYLENWLLPSREPIGALGHLWSLAVEEQFYLVWPLLVFLLPAARLPLLCVGVVLGAPLLRAWLLRAGVTSDAVYEWTITRVDSLAYGGFVAVALRSDRLHGIVARSWKALLVMTATLLAVVVWRYGRVHFHDGPMPIAGFSLLALGSGALVAGSVLAPDAMRLSRVLRWSPLRTLGRYSYGLYVIHYPFFCIVQQRLLQSSWRSTMQTPLGYVTFMVLGIAVAYGLAVVSFTVFEAPLLRLKRFFVAGESTPQ